MLVSFKIKNWCSFKEEASFSMENSKERRFSDTLINLEDSAKSSLLPITAIYGYNASGKSSFFKALKFIKDFITKPRVYSDPINVIPFKLDGKSQNLPSAFEIEFFTKPLNKVIRYSFSANSSEIFSEKLEIKTARSYRTVYERNKHKIDIDLSFKYTDEKEKILVQALSEKVPKNTLFLTVCAMQDIKFLAKVYIWFKLRLILVSPTTRFTKIPAAVIQNDDNLEKDNKSDPLLGVNQIISKLDLGVNSLKHEDIPFASLGLSDKNISDIKEHLKYGKFIKLANPNNTDVIIYKKNNELVASRLLAIHKDALGNNVNFELNEESDGTRRLIDISPLLLDLIGGYNDLVIVIDEFDRSLNPLLTRKIIQMYLERARDRNLKDGRKIKIQFIFTCHDISLLDQDIMRRDEYWVINKNTKGESSLSRISEMKKGLRFDQKLRDNYLNGEFGKPNFLK